VDSHLLGQFVERGDDVGDVGVLGLAQGRGDANDGDVEFAAAPVVRGRAQQFLLDQRGDLLGGDVLHVGFSRADGGHFLGVHVDPDHLKSGTPELDGQWEPDVAQADHSDLGLSTIDLAHQGVR